MRKNENMEMLRQKEKSVACRETKHHCLRDNGAKSSDGRNGDGATFQAQGIETRHEP